MTLATNQNEVQMNFFSWLFARMQEGGIVIMSIVLICGLVVLFLMVRSLFYVKNNPRLTKMIILINSIGLFALVTGVFGQLLQLINTLDYMEFRDEVRAGELAAGLKFTILPTLFGCFIFLISRLFTITLNWLKPHHHIN